MTPGLSNSDDASPSAASHMRLMGVPMGVVNEAHAVRSIVEAAEAGLGHWTITANLDHLRRYHREPLAKSLIDEADLVVADGMPLVWASRMVGKPLPERVAGSRMVWSICESASARGQSIFLLGADNGVADHAAAIFNERYPGLQIAGTACPPMGFFNDEREIERIHRQLEEAAPRIVFVALGFPKQDLLIRRLRERLPNASFVGVGISLSYVTGDVSLAPDWICTMGLEWAYRLSQEPNRLVRRYLVDGLPFALQLMFSAVWHRARQGRSGASTSWSDP